MLIGEYKNKVGDKNRVAVPRKFREELGDNLIVTRGYESSLIMVDTRLWKNLIKEFGDRAFAMSKVRDTRRFLIGGADEIELDKQGRFVLAENLLEHAEIKDEVVFVGLEDWVEIWDLERWKAKGEELKTEAAGIAETLNELRITNKE